MRRQPFRPVLSCRWRSGVYAQAAGRADRSRLVHRSRQHPEEPPDIAKRRRVAAEVSFMDFPQVNVNLHKTMPVYKIKLVIQSILRLSAATINQDNRVGKHVRGRSHRSLADRSYRAVAVLAMASRPGAAGGGGRAAGRGGFRAVRRGAARHLPGVRFRAGPGRFSCHHWPDRRFSGRAVLGNDLRLHRTQDRLRRDDRHIRGVHGPRRGGLERGVAGRVPVSVQLRSRRRNPRGADDHRGIHAEPDSRPCCQRCAGGVSARTGAGGGVEPRRSRSAI
jgi:hypothetical protein